MRGLLRSAQPGTVLAGVKATPCGWPTASLDPSCGRSLRTTSEAGREKNEQDPLNSSLYGSRGLPTHTPIPWWNDRTLRFRFPPR